MSEMSRDEMTARLETIEAKMDGRVATIEALINGMSGSMRELKEDIRNDAQARKSDRNTIVSTTLGTAVAIFLAIVGAVLSISSTNTGLVQAVIAAYESGKNSARDPTPPAPQSPPASKLGQ